MTEQIKAITIPSESVVISAVAFDYLMSLQAVTKSQEREIHALLDQIDDLKRELIEARNK